MCHRSLLRPPRQDFRRPKLQPQFQTTPTLALHSSRCPEQLILKARHFSNFLIRQPRFNARRTRKRRKQKKLDARRLNSLRYVVSSKRSDFAKRKKNDFARRKPSASGKKND